MDPPPPNRNWSIYTRPEIIQKYEILERVGSGAYSDVYRARRIADSLVVALKEVHDYQSAFREIEALQTLQNSPNVVVLHEYFWSEDEDAVLVLEFLRTDLSAVIRAAKGGSSGGGIPTAEIKRWMIQILHGVDACHRNSIAHRDLKPSNLLVSDDGVLKLADFGQARILLGPGIVVANDSPKACEQETFNQGSTFQTHQAVLCQEGTGNQDRRIMGDEGPFGESNELGGNASFDFDKETSVRDGDTSCLATCTTSDREDDPFKSSYSYEVEESKGEGYGQLTSCVGTRWFRAPELLYGSINYGQEIDLWSLGCIFAELFSLEPLFPGTSDIDQISKIFSVLGNLNEDAWPGCLKLPDYNIISFGKMENPTGLETSLPNCSPDEILIIKKLLCYDPSGRATAMELLCDKYFYEVPLPVPISELRVPSTNGWQDEHSSGGWDDYRGMNSDSDLEDFGPVNVTTTGTGFSIQFP